MAKKTDERYASMNEADRGPRRASQRLWRFAMAAAAAAVFAFCLARLRSWLDERGLMVRGWAC